MTNFFTDGQTLLIQVVDVVDAQGQPATLSTPPVWSSSDPTIFSPTPTDPTGMSASGVALKTGTVTITATSGQLSAQTVITLGAGQAASFQLAVSVVQPPAPPAAAPSGSQAS